MAPLFATVLLPHRLREVLPESPGDPGSSRRGGNRALPPPADRYRRLLEITDALRTSVVQRLPDAVWFGASCACVPATSGTPFDLQGALERLRADVSTRYGLGVACGLARTRLAADIAARLVAPSGLLHVLPGYERRVLAPVGLRWLDGVDARLVERFAASGIHTCGDLAEASDDTLRRVAGPIGAVLGRLARGDDPRGVPAPAPRCRWTVEIRSDGRCTPDDPQATWDPATSLATGIERALAAARGSAQIGGARVAELRLALWSDETSHADGRVAVHARGTTAVPGELAAALVRQVHRPPAWTRGFVTLILAPPPMEALIAGCSGGRAACACG